MSNDRLTPCYVIASNGFKDRISYEDDWYYGKSVYIGTASGDDDPRAIIAEDIRRHYDERNGIPVYHISDHGNEQRVRCVRLRKR